MSPDSNSAGPGARRPGQVGICVVRSEPIDHTRLYSVSVNLDVFDVSGQRTHRSSDISDVLRIVETFLREGRG